MTIKSWVRITPDAIVSDRPVPVAEGSGKDMLVSAFRALGCGYAKFHKMDTLSKAGFLASEILLSDELGRFEPREDRAVLLFNSSASLCDDRHYQNTINDPQNWFPSPAVFVYTLPNIVTGEIAIRNKYYGETCFYVMEKPDAGEICRIVGNAFQDRVTRSAVCGWAECSDDDTFEVVLFLVERTGTHQVCSGIRKHIGGVRMPQVNGAKVIKTMNMEELIEGLKLQMIEALNLDGMTPQDIDNDAPLFGDGLGLDSIDALELIVLLEKNYGIKLANPSEGKEVFRSVGVMADYIQKHRTK